MWEPIVKENKLYGLSLNPLGKKPILMYSNYGLDPEGATDSQLRSIENDFENDLFKWQLAESQRRLVEVDEAEYHWVGLVNLRLRINGFESIHKPFNFTFTADESNGKLINIKVI